MPWEDQRDVPINKESPSQMQLKRKTPITAIMRRITEIDQDS